MQGLPSGKQEAECDADSAELDLCMNILFTTAPSVLGLFLVARSEHGVCAILLGDDAAGLAHDLRRRFPEATLREAAAELAPLASEVAAFLARPASRFDVALDVRGSAFQQRVWRALHEIPVGSTETYGQVAARIGAPEAAKEVGEACAANVLAVAIPCHRVVRKDGGLAGYRWGLRRKRELLQREGVRIAETADLFE
jgi:AraC family transcriptional regulator of adaptative response/methylated-DNA-[protein]-cysteine methyltransferase